MEFRREVQTTYLNLGVISIYNIFKVRTLGEFRERIHHVLLLKLGIHTWVIIIAVII